MPSNNMSIDRLDSRSPFYYIYEYVVRVHEYATGERP